VIGEQFGHGRPGCRRRIWNPPGGPVGVDDDPVGVQHDETVAHRLEGATASDRHPFEQVVVIETDHQERVRDRERERRQVDAGDRARIEQEHHMREERREGRDRQEGDLFPVEQRHTDPDEDDQSHPDDDGLYAITTWMQ
jgi:hypothetical protein